MRSEASPPPRQGAAPKPGATAPGATAEASPNRAWNERLLDWGVRHCPQYLEPVFVAGYALVFFSVYGGARKALMANLRGLDPEAGWWRLRGRAARVFWSFTWTCFETAHAQAGHDCHDWEIVGLEHFDDLAGREGGALAVTAHMGNYDIAAPVFARRFGRMVHVVLGPEHDAGTLGPQEPGAIGSPAFTLRYDTGGDRLARELVGLLAAGEIVAMQGDRVGQELSPAPASFAGSVVSFPRGPFALAHAAGVPIYPIFIIRRGYRRYEVRVEPPIHWADIRATDGPLAIAGAISSWAGVLERVLRTYWHQWYLFEPVFPPPVPVDEEEDTGEAP